MLDQFAGNTPELPPHIPGLQRPSASIDLARLDPVLLNAAQRIDDAVTLLEPVREGIAPHSLVVGGFVRDALLGHNPKDLDLEVYGVDLKTLEKLLEDLFPGNIDKVGSSFGVIKIFLGKGLDIDVSIPRRDSKSGKGHKGFIPEFSELTVEEAASRRDFTINSLAADPATGTVVDPFNGLDDLENRTLRITNPATFVDDPLRVYRAVQFAARMEMDVDPGTFNLMRTMVDAGTLEELAPERITEELFKLLLKAEKPSIGLELMRSLGIVEKYYPEVHALTFTDHDPHWHPEGSVWNHTMMVVDAAAKLIRTVGAQLPDEDKLEVMLGAICHDLGKPLTTVLENGRIRSPLHEIKGVDPARTFLAKFKLPNSLAKAGEVFTRYHMDPGMIYREFETGRIDEAAYVNRVRLTVKGVKTSNWKAFLLLTEADHRGRGLPGVAEEPYLPGEKFARAVIEHKLDTFGVEPLLRGHGRDLMAMGIKSGPEIGKIIAEVERLRDRGVYRTKEEALDALYGRYMITGADFLALGYKQGEIIGKMIREVKSKIKSGELKSRDQVLEHIEREYGSYDAQP